MAKDILPLADTEIADAEHVYDFTQFREEGMLWLFNTLLHARGVAMMFHVDENEKTIGWELVRSENDEPWYFFPDEEVDERYRKANKAIANARIIKEKNADE